MPDSVSSSATAASSDDQNWHLNLLSTQAWLDDPVSRVKAGSMKLAGPPNPLDLAPPMHSSLPSHVTPGLRALPVLSQLQTIIRILPVQS